METTGNKKRQSNIEKTVNKARKKIPYSYSLSYGELVQLYSTSDWFEAIDQAYLYGFIRGSRAKAKGRVPAL